VTHTTITEILPLIDQAKVKGKRIVLATGVFDILHSEHLNFLRKAKQVGDLLIVGLESDLRVKQTKGSDRPINTATQRLFNLKKLNVADVVFILPTQFSTPQDHENLIKQLSPHILAVSSNSPHLEAKRKILTKYHGKVKIVHQHNPLISTTQIINNQKIHEK